MTDKCSTPPEVKLCKDCAHFRPYEDRFLFWRIRGPVEYSKCAAFPEPVGGTARKFCDLERDYGDQCGPKGKLWVAK